MHVLIAVLYALVLPLKDGQARVEPNGLGQLAPDPQQLVRDVADHRRRAQRGRAQTLAPAQELRRPQTAVVLVARLLHLHDLYPARAFFSGVTLPSARGYTLSCTCTAAGACSHRHRRLLSDLLLYANGCVKGPRGVRVNDWRCAWAFVDSGLGGNILERASFSESDYTLSGLWNWCKGYQLESINLLKGLPENFTYSDL